jgi:aspartate carbamoyltransferase catalytic subunit
MTRIQDEWDVAGESRSLDVSRFCLSSALMERLKQDAVILHPLPRRQEIPVEIDDDPRAMYWRQVRNGMWIRAALILNIFDQDHEVDRYYEDLVS